MSFWTNPLKVIHNIWDDIANSGLTRYLRIVEKDAEGKDQETLVAVGKQALEQAREILEKGALIGDIIKTAVELAIPILEGKGIVRSVALAYSVISALVIAVENHEA